jgi:hypothetical protein
MITKALLLGYTIYDTGADTYGLLDPQGREIMGYTHRGPVSFGPNFLRFPAKWMAAKQALELAGVIDAKKSR